MKPAIARFFIKMACVLPPLQRVQTISFHMFIRWPKVRERKALVSLKKKREREIEVSLLWNISIFSVSRRSKWNGWNEKLEGVVSAGVTNHYRDTSGEKKIRVVTTNNRKRPRDIRPTRQLIQGQDEAGEIDWSTKQPRFSWGQNVEHCS